MPLGDGWVLCGGGRRVGCCESACREERCRLLAGSMEKSTVRKNPRPEPKMAGRQKHAKRVEQLFAYVMWGTAMGKKVGDDCSSLPNDQFFVPLANCGHCTPINHRRRHDWLQYSSPMDEMRKRYDEHGRTMRRSKPFGQNMCRISSPGRRPLEGSSAAPSAVLRAERSIDFDFYDSLSLLYKAGFSESRK